MFRFALLLAAGLPLAAQSFILGTPADPCTGGAPLVIAGTTATVRWDNAGFACTFPLTTSGAYIVQMKFLEPCFAANACAGGQVTKVNQRVESVYLNDQPTLVGLDPFAAGATDKQGASRWALIYADKSITVRVQTSVRSGVLAAVSIIPFAQIQLARSEFHCAGNFLVCGGLQLWAETSADGTKRYYTAEPATPEALAISACGSALPCWQLIAQSVQ